MDQLAIALTGVIAVALSQSNRAEFRRWSCIFGLMAQPFWFYATWTAGQAGMFGLCFLYMAAYLRGFYLHWIKK